MDDLTCAVCSEVYEMKVREPVTLPKCGHTFCRLCLSSLQSMSLLFKCPTCRSPHNGSLVTNLPPVYVVLNILEKHKLEKGTVNMCKTHDDPIRLWCNSCQEELCGQCLFEHHMTKAHDVVKINIAVDEIKQILINKAEQLRELIRIEKDYLVKELHEIALSLGAVYSKSQSLTDKSKRISEVLHISHATNQIKTLIRNQNLLENLAGEFSIRSLKTDTSHLKDAQSLSPATSLTETNHNQCCPEVYPLSNNGIVAHAIVDDVLDENHEKEDSKCYKDDSDSSQDDESLENESHQTLNCNRSLPATFPDVPMWSFTCDTPGGQKYWPKLSWYDFLAQVPVVQLLVPPENPIVFLQLGVKGKIFGQIHIQLWGRLRRAQNFLALCLGTLGPSYIGSKFSHVARKGKFGERLVGGFYVSEKGYTGYQVIEGLEWRGEYIGPIRAGVIGGSKGRQPKYNSCFCISTKDYPNGKSYCPFGEIVSGLEVAQEIVHYEPISDVTITDTGLVPLHHDT